MKSIVLPASHYAAKWPANVQRTSQQLTKLGAEYARTKNQEALLEILQSLHGYLVKYLGMILQGHIPFRGGEINQDTLVFLRCFVPKGTKDNRSTLGLACRTLHLAFKGMEAAEVYDILMLCMVRAVNKYDPTYHEKIAAVARAIDTEFHDRKFITTAQLSAHLRYDCTRYLRMLDKRGLLVLAKQGETQGVRTTDAWPPPPEFFKSGPVGLSYFATKWFRYYLVEWITNRMTELETQDGVLQLDHRRNAHTTPGSVHNGPWSSRPHAGDSSIPHSDGDYTLAHGGKSIAADMSLTKLPVDIGALTLAWVHAKQDGILALSERERLLLYYIFVREMDWANVAKAFSMELREVKKWYQTVLAEVRSRVKKSPHTNQLTYGNIST